MATNLKSLPLILKMYRSFPTKSTELKSFLMSAKQDHQLLQHGYTIFPTARRLRRVFRQMMLRYFLQ